MTNDYYNPGVDYIPYSRVTSNEHDAENNSVAAGFAKLPGLAQMQSGNLNYIKASGTADAISVTSPTTPITTYAGRDGYRLSIQILANNTIAGVTLNVDGQGALPIKTMGGGDLAAASLLRFGIYDFTLNETENYFVVSFNDTDLASASAAAAAASASAAAASAASIGAKEAHERNAIPSASFEVSVIDGDVVYWDSGTSKYVKAVADSTVAADLVGVADVSGSIVETEGLTSGLFSGLTPGSKYYLHATVAGTVTTTDTNVFVGYAKSATEMFLGLDTRQVVVNGSQTFTSSGSLTEQTNANFYEVEAWGAGGGGHNRVSTIGNSSGGGGGGYNRALFLATDLTFPVTVTIGAGGAGGPDTTTAAGADGGDTTFGAYLTGNGGEGGDGSEGGLGGGLGAVYHSTERLSISTYGAGTGGAEGGSAALAVGGSSTKGGGGGGGAEENVDGTGGISVDGGNGGAGGGTATAAGTNGTVPGGGGGASMGDGGGGNGADGQIIVRWWT